MVVRSRLKRESNTRRYSRLKKLVESKWDFFRSSGKRKRALRIVWSHFDEGEVQRIANKLNKMRYPSMVVWSSSRDTYLLYTNAPKKVIKKYLG